MITDEQIKAHVLNTAHKDPAVRKAVLDDVREEWAKEKLTAWVFYDVRSISAPGGHFESWAILRRFLEALR